MKHGRRASSANGKCAAISVVRAMRWMNRIAPSAKPTTIASVKPTRIVSTSVTPNTAASPRGERNNEATALRSTMFQATTASTPASAASGMNAASGAASNTNNSKNAE
jgi:hypothetical protein